MNSEIVASKDPRLSRPRNLLPHSILLVGAGPASKLNPLDMAHEQSVFKLDW